MIRMSEDRQRRTSETRRVAFISPKGGSGKTVLTATLATFVQRLGYRALVVDTDSATNGMTLLFLKEVVECAKAWGGTSPCRGVYDHYRRDRDPRQSPPLTAFKTSMGFDFLPASFSLDQEWRDQAAATVLARSLQELVGISAAYDFVFLDAQAGSESQSAVAASPKFSDEVVIVSEFDPMSIAGIDRLKKVEPCLTHDRTWILLNKVLPEFADDFGESMQVFRYLPPIPWDADVVRSYARRRLALDMETGNPFTLAVLRTAKALLGDTIGDRIAEWAAKKRGVLVEPISQQYDEVQSELEYLLRRRVTREAGRQERRLRRVVRGAGLGLISAAGTALLFWAILPQLLLLDVLVSLATGILAFAVIVLWRPFPTDARLTVEEQVEQQMAERRIEQLYERLGKLEALKESDLDTLMSVRLDEHASSRGDFGPRRDGIRTQP